MKELLSTYVNYNLWANKRIVEMLRENSALIDKEVKSSFTSLRKTMYHIWGAEELWYKRLHGESLDHVPAMDFKGSFEEAEVKFIFISKLFHEFVSSKDENFFTQPCSYKDTRGNPYTHPHWWMIHHCMNHSTFHRGQLVTMLRAVGVTTIHATDMIVYFRETKQ